MNKPENREFAVVGKRLPRLDAPAKAKGEARFTNDLFLANMVYAKIKRSPLAHARIRRIDYSRALALPGVLAVVTGADAPRPFCVMPHVPTETVMAIDKVRYAGEPVAAVAAMDEETAEDALELIDVEYEELPVLLDPIEAMQRDDARIHEAFARNIHYESEQNFGDVEAALAASHLVIEDVFRTSYVTPAFIEPHAAVADYDTAQERLTLYCPIQMPHHLHRTLAEVMQMPMEKIRVSVPAVGGGFGGKTEAASCDLCAAILSRKLGRPVKVPYTRAETFAQNKGRHPCIMKLRLGFERDGRITGLDFDNTLDGGAHASWGIIVLFFTAALCHLPYRIANVRFRGRRVFTNKPSCGAQRGLGGVQVRMALEGALDQAADRLGIDPFELRMRNAVESGYTTASGVHVPHAEFKQCLRNVVRASGYLDKRGKLPFGQGIGLAAGYYTSGALFMLYPTHKPQATAIVRIDTEAGITLFTGATDIGQGSTTVLAQMVAEELGVALGDINVVAQDTALAPFDNGTFDSRVTYGTGQAVRRAAQDAKRQLAEIVAAMLGVPAEHLHYRGGAVASRFEPRKRVELRDAVARHVETRGSLVGVGHFAPPRRAAHRQPGGMSGPSPSYAFGAQVAQVEVDLETGRIRVLDYYAADDCGQPINPMSVEGQVEGSVMMGLGQALSEEMRLSPEGRLLNPDLHDYKMPTAVDMPRVHCVHVDSYDPDAPFGAKESGEGPINPVAAAVLNAVHDAIGVRFREVPLTPEKVLRALGKMG
ncbi:MAG: molybdopterin-dependent oxidoreductase [Burkholderiales bacterium]|nr:molybdopterin-dependent oxidoreductase [Burkholderiales bacterium]